MQFQSPKIHVGLESTLLTLIYTLFTIKIIGFYFLKYNLRVNLVSLKIFSVLFKSMKCLISLEIHFLAKEYHTESKGSQG